MSLQDIEKSNQNQFCDSDCQQSQNQAIIGEDNRKIVLNPGKYPYCSTAQIKTSYLHEQKDYEIKGNVTMITYQYGITSAHNVYNDFIKQKLATSYLIFKRQLPNKDIIYPIQKILVPKQYIKNQQINPKGKNKYDWALVKIKVKDNFERFESVKYLNIKKNRSLKQKPYIMIASYVHHLTNNSDVYKKSEEKILNHDDFYIKYLNSTEYGQSGSAILYLNQQNQYQIIGIHKGTIKKKIGERNSQEYFDQDKQQIFNFQIQSKRRENQQEEQLFNYGIYINDEFIDQMNKLLQENGELTYQQLIKQTKKIQQNSNLDSQILKEEQQIKHKQQRLKQLKELKKLSQVSTNPSSGFQNSQISKSEIKPAQNNSKIKLSLQNCKCCFF